MEMIALIVLGIVLIASLAVLKLFFFKSAGSVRNGTEIIFCGTRDSGKTTLLSRIVNEEPNNKDLRTQTSQKENCYPYGQDAKFNLVDIPGHERVRMQILEKHINKTKALIFVIDAEKVRDDIRDSAEYFVNILSNENLYKRTSRKDRCQILVIGNKQDSASAKSINAIKVLLEKEINILKEINTRSGVQNLKATNQMDNEQEFENQTTANAKEIFFQGEGKFCFDQVQNFDIKFVGTSCVKDDDSFSFSPVSDWLNQQVAVQ